MSTAAVVEAAWAEDTPARRVLVASLGPFAAAYGAGVAVRNALYDRRILRAERVPATVVSVGNVTVGGTGKTPTALWLCERLAARGRRVALVARGYRKRLRGVVVVGDGERLCVAPADGGDEAALAALRLRIPVVTGERRAAAAREACARFRCDTIVLDDGFQHRALARDADLVLLPADAGVARVLPAGPWREPRDALRRAHAVLVLGDERRLPARPDAPAGVPAFVGRLVPTAAVHAEADGLVAQPLDALARRGVVAVAGIAHAERFWATLERLGVATTARLGFPDHHPYDAVSVARIRQAGGVVVTTEKDLVKLARLPGTADLGLQAVRVAPEIEDGERLVDALLEVALHAD